MDDLAQKKLEAEITHLRAQAAKLDADRELSRVSFGHRFIEVLKVAGALIIGAGGVTAAVTGYQLTEVKRERMQLEIDRLEDKVKQQNDQLLDGTRKKSDLDAAITSAQEQLESAQSQITAAQVQFVKTQKDLTEVGHQLANAKKAAPAASDTTSLDAAITRTKQIETELTTTDSQLRTALAKIEASDTAVRTQAVNNLAFQYGSSPEAKAAILAMLRPDSVNKLSEQGLINCLVILARHKTGSWSKVQKEQAREAIKQLDQRKLTERERSALDEFKKTLE